jgi:hypothetical protein
MAAHDGVRADDGVILDGSAAQDGGAPAHEHVVADVDRFLVAENLAG